MSVDSLGFEYPTGLNGVIPGGGRCAACHSRGQPDNYLLCQVCWNRLPQSSKADLSRLWSDVAERNWTLGEVRERQASALRTIDHVSPTFDPHLPFEDQNAADVAVFCSIRPDAVVTS